MTTPRISPARARILDTAAELFGAHGIRGVGVDTIIARSGVAKSTLYAHFPSKDDLVLAYLARADTAWQGKLHSCAEAAGADPAAQLVGLFDALHAACARAGFRGCTFINTAAESAPGSIVHTATVTHKQAVRAWIGELAARAGATDPGALAFALTVLLDGALAATAIENRAEIPDEARRAAQTLVTAALPAADR